MTDPPSPFPADAMLREAGWLKNLALSLVHDEHLAEDVVQSTWLTALMHPPREAGALRAWLRKVALRIAVRTRGRERRRTTWETGASRTEAQPPTADLVARAAVHRALVDAVLELEEPYRSTVLLRYFEDLSHREIAQRQDVAYATVQTRLHRALAQLRGRMDRANGGREAWKALIVLPPIRAAALVTAATGGLIVGTQVKIGLAAAVLLVIGAVGWQLSRVPGPEPETEGAAQASMKDTSASASTPEAAGVPGKDSAKHALAPQPLREVEEPTHTLVGLVVDERNDQPVGGAEATLTTDADPLSTGKTIKTSSDGRFSFQTEQPFHQSALRLRIRSPDFAPADIDGPSAFEKRGNGRDVDLGKIKLVRGASVRGRVVAASDQHPIEGALIFLDTERPFSHSPSFVTARPAGRSGPDGSFTLTDRVAPTRSNPAVIFALHEGGIDWALLQVVHEREDIGGIEVLARPAAPVRVRVVDGQEKAVPGVAIVAVPYFPPYGLPVQYLDRMTASRSSELESWHRSTFSIGDAVDQGPRQKFGARFLASTDAEGWATFDRLPRGRFEAEYDRSFQTADSTVYEFVALGASSGSVRWNPASDSSTVTLVLKPKAGRAVSGFVRTSDGSPIPKATLWLDGVGQQKTDEHGQYRFGEAMPPNAGLMVSAKGFATVRRSVAMKPEATETTADFVLTPAVPISGRVVDQAGRTLAGVHVALARQAEDQWLHLMPDSRPTAVDGRFAFSNTDAGEWKVRLEAPGTDLAPSAHKVVRGGDQNVEVVMYRIEPGHATVIADIVDSRSGTPVDPGRADLWRDVRHANAESITSPEISLSAGRVVARGVGAGKWILLLEATGFANVRHPFTVTPSDDEIRLRVEIGRPGAVVARVLLDDLPAGDRPDRFAIFAWNESPRWVTDTGKPAPGATRGFATADAGNGWTCRFEDVRPNVPIRFWLTGYNREELYDEKIVTVGFGEEKTIELRPTVRGTATFTVPPTLVGYISFSVAGDDGGWNQVGSWELERGKGWTYPLARRPGPFRWRAQLWPLDLPPALRVPKTIEGASEVQAGKTVTIPIALDPK